MGVFDFFRGKPTEEKLARELLAAASRENVAGWSYDPAEHELRHATSGTVNLGNMFLEYSSADAKNRPNLLAKYADLLIKTGREVPGLWALAQKAIYPVVRWNGDMDVVEIADRGSGKEPHRERPALPFHEDTVIRIVYDFGASTMHVTNRDVETWGVSIQDVYARALQNLQALERPRWIELSPGLWQIESAVSYEESMLLRNDVLDLLEVSGDLLLMPSNRGVLLAADSRNGAAIEALLDAALGHRTDSPWPLSTLLLRRIPDGFEPVALNGRPGIKLASLRTIELAQTYGDQKSALEKWHGRTNRDIYVAIVGLMRSRKDPDVIWSYCTWTQGVHSWLAHTDLVAILRDKGNEEFETIVVRWNDAHDTCGTRMRELTENPPRFEVIDFPEADEWRRLKDVAIEL